MKFIKPILVMTTAIAVCAVQTVSIAAPKSSVKLTEIRTCPITGEKVVGNGAGNETVGSYKVYFCCGGCKPAFDKLNLSQKLAKIKSAASK